jgi:GTP-binding protein EngB required for normal cell division
MQTLSMQPGTECLVFIGNPGVGKSSIINSIIGKQVFTSGLSATGVTKACQSYEQGGRIYIDTPGLSDIAIKHQAAQEIEKALKKNKNYRIFFVLTLEAGRLRPDDLNTIHRVMEAINHPRKSFHVVINKITKKERREILDDKVKYRSLCDQMNIGSQIHEHVCYIEHDQDLEYEHHEFIALDERIGKFIHDESSLFFLKDNQVAKINSESVEEMKKRIQDEEARLKRQLEDQRRQEEEMKRQIEKLEQERKLSRLRHNSLNVSVGPRCIFLSENF